jgi:hypothetical protein
MPSTGTGLKVLSILQNHYVERMGKGLVVNMPYVISLFAPSLIAPTPQPPTCQLTEYTPSCSCSYSSSSQLHMTRSTCNRPMRYRAPCLPGSLATRRRGPGPGPVSEWRHLSFFSEVSFFDPADTVDGGSTRSLVSSVVPWTLSLGTRSDSTQT